MGAELCRLFLQTRGSSWVWLKGRAEGKETSRKFEGMGNETRYLFLGLLCLPPARLPLVHWLSSSYDPSKLLWGRSHHLAVLYSSVSCSPSFASLGLEMVTVHCILPCWFPSIECVSITRCESTVSFWDADLYNGPILYCLLGKIKNSH